MISGISFKREGRELGQRGLVVSKTMCSMMEMMGGKGIYGNSPNNCSTIISHLRATHKLILIYSCNFILFWTSNNEAIVEKLSHLLLWVEIIHSMILLWFKQYSKQIRNKLQNDMVSLVVLVVVEEAVRWSIGYVSTKDPSENKGGEKVFNLAHDFKVHKVE